MVLNGDIIEYADYGSIEGTTVATDVELLMYFFNNAGFDLLRLSGGGEPFDHQTPFFEDPVDVFNKMNFGTYNPSEYWYEKNMEGTRIEPAVSTGSANIQTAVDIFRTVGEANRALKQVRKSFTRTRKNPKAEPFLYADNIFNSMSNSMPLNYSNVTNASGWNISIPMETTHGGPGIQTNYADRQRLRGAQTMSTYSRYLCTSYAPSDAARGNYRAAGADQPLHMEINSPFADEPNVVSLPIAQKSTNSLYIGAVCFNLQWPGYRMHEQPETNDVTNKNIFSNWYQLTTDTIDKTVNVDFGKVLQNTYWRKMVIGNVHLRMEFNNHSVYDHMIHIIWYTNKRKGIQYVNEFDQWIASSESTSPANSLIASDFYQRGILPFKPPCKILRHKKFILKAGKPTLNWGFSENNYTTGYRYYKGGANRKVVKMKSTSGYTLKRDNLTNLTPSTDEDTWLESTAVEEERMIYCQILACPIRKRVAIISNQINQATSATVYKVQESSFSPTKWPGTIMQEIDEVYQGFPDGNEPEEYTPIPGIEVDIRRKVYFKVDKEIELS